MALQTEITTALLVAIVIYLAIRWLRRFQLRRAQRAKLAEVKKRHSSPERIRQLEARQAFERGDDSKGIALLNKDKPDSSGVHKKKA